MNAQDMSLSLGYEGDPQKTVGLASAHGDIEKLKEGLKGLDSCDAALNESGETAMHYAARYGMTRVIEHLIQQGANVDAANKDGFTPLHIAAKSGNGDVVTTLVMDGNADVRKRTVRFLVSQFHTVSVVIKQNLCP
eukprot:gb/GECG01013357.1/.p1 GENE.gb/GECG01013357.1/~~gb/GECG01013357.1/.p1  ORF type:complete len:136 (+),score=16.94 gb/GECG01013357.1/:1-408(+)